MPSFSPCTTSWHGIDVSQLCKKPELVSIVLKKEESLHVCCSGHHCHHAFCGTWMLLSFHGSSGYSASGVNNPSTHTLAHSNHSTIFQQKTLKINSPCSGHKHSEFFKMLTSPLLLSNQNLMPSFSPCHSNHSKMSLYFSVA